MTLLHLHLITNHLPVLGTAFALALLGFGVWRRSAELTKAALGALVIFALLALPAYFTGDPAKDSVKWTLDVSRSAIEKHEEAATAALIGSGVLGVAAVAGLWYYRRNNPVPVWFGSIILAAAVVVCGLMIWTATLGGQIRHSEIRSDGFSIFRHH